MLLLLLVTARDLQQVTGSKYKINNLNVFFTVPDKIQLYLLLPGRFL